MTSFSPAVVATSIAATGVMAICAGFLFAGTASHADPSYADRSRPIVDPNAWSVGATAEASVSAPAQVAKLDTWDTADVAIETTPEEVQYMDEVMAISTEVPPLEQAWLDGAPAETIASSEGEAVIKVVSDAEAALLWENAGT